MRRVSLHVTRWLVATRATPNALTIAMIVVGLLAALAAALPFLWISAQILTGQADLTVIGLVMTLLQPGVVVLAWLLLLLALVAQPRIDVVVPGDRDGDADSGETERAPQNVG
jgi:hypothetical protein